MNQAIVALVLGLSIASGGISASAATGCGQSCITGKCTSPGATCSVAACEACHSAPFGGKCTDTGSGGCGGGCCECQELPSANSAAQPLEATAVATRHRQVGVREVLVAISYRRPPKPLSGKGVVLVASEAEARRWFDAATVRRLVAKVDFANEDLMIVRWLKRKGGRLAHAIPSRKRGKDIEVNVTANLSRRDYVLASRYFAVPKSNGGTFRPRASR